MENLISLVTVPTITALVWGAMMLLKTAFDGKERVIRLIPVFSVLLGVGFGVAAFYLVSGVMPAENVLTAMLIGGASGAAATCSHQVFKQLSKPIDIPAEDITNIPDGQ